MKPPLAVEIPLRRNGCMLRKRPRTAPIPNALLRGVLAYSFRGAKYELLPVSRLQRVSEPVPLRVLGAVKEFPCAPHELVFGPFLIEFLIPLLIP